MCGNEPCRHERDYTIGDAMKSYVAASELAGDAAFARDAALAEVARLTSQVEVWMGAHGDLVKRSNRHVVARDVAEAAIARVRVLHACDDNDRDAEWCAECGFSWPCSTIAALADPT